MTLQEAAKLLDLSIDATPAEVDAMLQRITERLQEKIAADAGESYKKKHRDALAKAVAAADLLKLAAEVNSAAASTPAAEVSFAASPAPARRPAPASQPASRPAPVPVPAAPASGGNTGRNVAIFAALALLGGGGTALLLKNRAAPDAAPLVVAEENPVAEKPATESAAPVAPVPEAPVVNPFAARIAAARLRWTALEAEFTAAERLRAELAEQALAAASGPAPAAAELRARAAAQERLLAWGGDFLRETDVPALLARLANRPTADGARLADEIDARLDRAEAALAERKPGLLALGRPVSIVSEPAGLRYSLADAHGRIREGTTPATVDAPWGAARVTVFAPAAGLPDWTGEIEVGREREPGVRAAFVFAPFRVSSLPAGLPYEIVRPDGSIRRGLTPDELDKVPVGPVTVRVVRPGWPALEQALEIVEDRENACVLEFMAGQLTLQSAPSGATVSLEGRELGVTPLTLSDLVPGPHAYELQLRGYAPARIAAEVRARETAVATATLAPSGKLESGQPHLVHALGLELMPVPAGSFVMGSPRLDPAHNAGEVQYEVVISREFWLGKHEVTRAQWSAVMGLPAPADAAGRLPVTRVSWEEAVDFCHRLNERERAAGLLPAGHAYTLPTEAQWEYACRAGNIGLYGGFGALADHGWHRADGVERPQPGGLKRDNAWGLHDMHGNVKEWCADWFEFYPQGRTVDPVGPRVGFARVHRGGAFDSEKVACRSAHREHSAPNHRADNLGFRLALSPLATSAR